MITADAEPWKQITKSSLTFLEPEEELRHRRQKGSERGAALASLLWLVASSSDASAAPGAKKIHFFASRLGRALVPSACNALAELLH
jgi:hypothetical protein